MRPRAQEAAAKHGVARAHGSYRAAVRRRQRHRRIVYILRCPSPSMYRGRWRRFAQGKHVLVEKPFALSDCRRRTHLRRRARAWRGGGRGDDHGIPSPRAPRAVPWRPRAAIGQVRLVRSTFSISIAEPAEQHPLAFRPRWRGDARHRLLPGGHLALAGRRGASLRERAGDLRARSGRRDRCRTPLSIWGAGNHLLRPALRSSTAATRLSARAGRLRVDVGRHGGVGGRGISPSMLWQRQHPAT